MNIKQIHSAYFIGIGGIGMSALARWFHHNNVQVVGYDKTPSTITESLINEGIAVSFDESVAALPDFLNQADEKVLVVYTPAIPADHSAFAYLKSAGFALHKRAAVLGEITKGMFTIAVAGTHGKTTTSSMVAHILKEAGVNITGFLGGISANYNTNMLFNEGDMSKATVVVEADEFDRSFLTLHPNIAILTSTDADHLDIYGGAEALKTSFADFLRKVNPEGEIFIRQNLWAGLNGEGISAKHTDYGLNEGASVMAYNIRIANGLFIFDVKVKGEVLADLQLRLPGYHNVENATAAIAVARSLDVPAEKIRAALASYDGVKRRFEYIVKGDDFVFIDDYAHHPSEISAMLKSVKAMYPEKSITVLFQPHLFSRTKDFAPEFCKSLSLADEVLLLDIYPAREAAIPGITSSMLLNNITSTKKQLLSKEEALQYAAANTFDIFITLGAGDIDRLVSPLKDIFNKVDAV